MIPRLQQPHAQTTVGPDPGQHVLHELTPDRLVLDGRVDRDRSQPSNVRPLVQEVATHDAAVELCHYAVEARVLQQPADQPGRSLGA